MGFSGSLSALPYTVPIIMTVRPSLSPNLLQSSSSFKTLPLIIIFWPETGTFVSAYICYLNIKGVSAVSHSTFRASLPHFTVTKKRLDLCFATFEHADTIINMRKIGFI